MNCDMCRSSIEQCPSCGQTVTPNYARLKVTRGHRSAWWHRGESESYNLCGGCSDSLIEWARDREASDD